MVPGPASTTSRCGPWIGPSGEQDLGPERTVAATGADPAPARRVASADVGAAASQIAAGPSPWRARVAASRPSVDGSSRTSQAQPRAGRRERPARARRGARPRRRRSPGHAPGSNASRTRAPPGRARPSPSRARSATGPRVVPAIRRERVDAASPRRRSTGPSAHPISSRSGQASPTWANPTSRVDPLARRRSR